MFLNDKSRVDVREIKQYNVLLLALVGDGVHTLFVREKLATISPGINTQLHYASKKYIRASAQSIAMDNIDKILNSEEKMIVRRARNNKTKTAAKNATVREYNNATAFEALLGYLYLIDRQERLIEILEKSWEVSSDDN